MHSSYAFILIALQDRAPGTRPHTTAITLRGLGIGIGYGMRGDQGRPAFFFSLLVGVKDFVLELGLILACFKVKVFQTLNWLVSNVSVFKACSNHMYIFLKCFGIFIFNVFESVLRRRPLLGQGRLVNVNVKKVETETPFF
jgi:hypothetical protein